MHKLDPFIVDERGTIKDAIFQIENNNCRCVIVVRNLSKKTVAGVFSQGDVLRAILEGVDVHTPIKNVLSPTFKCLKSRDLKKAADWVCKGLTLIPVVTDSYALKDVITFFDVIEECARAAGISSRAR